MVFWRATFLCRIRTFRWEKDPDTAQQIAVYLSESWQSLVELFKFDFQFGDKTFFFFFSFLVKIGLLFIFHEGN